MVAKLRDEFVAGRLSHDTFLHRVNAVFGSRRQADLPPLVADLPAGPATGGLSLVGRFRGAWSRMTRPPARAPQAHGTGPAVTPARESAPVRMTTSMTASSDRKQQLFLQFPRAVGDQFTIGRDASCDLAIADMTVSRLHAQLERTADGWLISDLESTNGTRVNGWRVRGKVPVRAGDLVSFGSLEAIFSPGKEEPPRPNPSHSLETLRFAQRLLTATTGP